MICHNVVSIYMKGQKSYLMVRGTEVRIESRFLRGCILGDKIGFGRSNRWLPFRMPLFICRSLSSNP